MIRALLCLDNVEVPQIVEELLLGLPKARLLLTSRRSEWPDDLGMVIWPLETLPRPQSRELLCKLAPRMRELPDEELDEIAERLGDLPLALDLAGRYLKERPDLSPSGYLIELDEAGSALEHTSLKDWVTHSPTKHATSLAATFALSWNRLSDDEIDALAKQIFKACGYCAPNVPILRQLLAKTVRPKDIGPKLDLAMRRLSELGLITPTIKGPSLHLLLAEFARIKDRDTEESIFPILAETIADLANQANESGLPGQMKPLSEHLKAVAQASEDSGQKTAGKLWNELGRYLCSLAEYKEGMNSLEKALTLDEKVYGFEHKDVATDNVALARAFEELGNWQEARNCCEKALRIDEKVLGPNHHSVARDLDHLAVVLRDVGNLQGAKKCSRRALKIDEKVHRQDHPDVAIHVSNLGMTLRRLGDLQGAKKCYKRALKIDEKVYGPEHPYVAIRFNNLGIALRQMGELAEAKENCEKALKINENVYGLDHPDVAIVANNLGMILKDSGDLNEARKLTEKALKIDEKVYGPDHPNVARDAGSLGLILKDQGELKEAKKICERAIKIAEKSYGENHRITANYVSNLGLVLKDQGDLEEAKKLYERALKIEECINGHDHNIDVADQARAYGLLLKDLGDLEGAKKNFRRALRIAMDRLGKDHPYTIEVRRELNHIDS